MDFVASMLVRKGVNDDPSMLKWTKCKRPSIKRPGVPPLSNLYRTLATQHSDFLLHNSIDFDTTSIKMLFSTITLLFATAILAAPTDIQLGSAAIAPELVDQGDGFYRASYNESGHINVEFTPMAELTKRVPTKEYIARSTQVVKRDGTECGAGKSNNIFNLDHANDQLAHNEDGQYVDAGSWGWVSCFNSSWSYEHTQQLITHT
jgi:hypothetical protein